MKNTARAVLLGLALGMSLAPASALRAEEGHKMSEKVAQTIHRKQMSQAEIDKEIVEIREEFDALVMLLEENQRQG